MREEKPSKQAEQRIAKVLAQAGVCSRREGERWVQAGRVSVNGVVITAPSYHVSPDDSIAVDGKHVKAKDKPRIWLYHKPIGLLTTHKDPQGRPTVFQALPRDMPRVVSVGRLDQNSEGLLLLTNQGKIAHYFESSDQAYIRKYRVRVFGQIPRQMIEEINNGLKIKGIWYKKVKVGLEETKTWGQRSKNAQNTWLRFELREGKNREIRNILAHFDLKISRLVRISYGPFKLDKLPPGAVKEVPRDIIEKIFFQKRS